MSITTPNCCSLFSLLNSIAAYFNLPFAKYLNEERESEGGGRGEKNEEIMNIFSRDGFDELERREELQLQCS